ncbi:type IV pilus inner membrane component PilO [Salinibius halmophilus]|uniref:type 4a pilus biogenesis protein PilO n=1 Tax=Salinibius halmophilus TaxID=1853216 RepID=UPI000E663742|nr:type 4a pilus biogenesis protein PilO [Salinibius halmophilus]
MAKSPVADFFAGFKKFDPNNDLGNFGVWPPVVRVTALILIVALVLGATYYFQIGDKQAQLEREQAAEVQKKNTLRIKAGQAANLEEYERQKEQVEEQFEVLKKRLPTESEISELNSSLGFSARQTGLELISQRIGSPVSRDEFFEQPINLELVGSYHEVGNFISAVAREPRIVTLHDFSIAREGDSSPEKLRVTMQAKTYRYKETGQ